MRSLVHIEERNLRIKKKLKVVEELYDYAFELERGVITKAKAYKMKLKLTVNEKDLTLTAKKLAANIKEIKIATKECEKLNVLVDRLTKVHDNIVDIIRNEFKPLRERNNSISVIE